MNMIQNKSGNELAEATPSGPEPTHEPSEEALAAQEFASLVRQPSRRGAVERGENYEVHPCKRVRGYILRLPIIGWTIWHPTADAALNYAGRLAGIYPAECCVYDADGGLHFRQSAAVSS